MSYFEAVNNEREFSIEDADAWQPGDPLYRIERYAYVFNFRDDAFTPEPGLDAARWPDPFSGNNLDRFESSHHGVEAFIAGELASRAEIETEGEVA